MTERRGGRGGQTRPEMSLAGHILIGEPWEAVVASIYRLLPTSRLGDSPLQRSGEAELSRTRVGKLFRVSGTEAGLRTGAERKNSTDAKRCDRRPRGAMPPRAYTCLQSMSSVTVHSGSSNR